MDENTENNILKLITNKKDDKDIKKNVSKESLMDLIANFETMVETIRWIAKLNKAKYDALIAEGFDPKQALELCKSIY